MSVTGTGGTTSFVYGAEGERLLRKDPGGTTLYLGKQEIRLSAAGGTPSVTRYYTHGGKTVAMQQGGTLTWLAGDHQGTEPDRHQPDDAGGHPTPATPVRRFPRADGHLAG